MVNNSNGTILLVDDSANDIEITLHALRLNRINNHVDVIRDGEDALNYFFCETSSNGAIAHNLLFVLLDIKLPKVNGIEVLAKLKSHRTTRHIPVIMLTASNQEKDINECYELGANSYIVKPVNFDDFRETIRILGSYWIEHNRQVFTQFGGSRE